MKRTVYFLLACLLVASCELERSDNGNLDGFWQLTDIDSLSLGRSVDVHERGVFWAVQMRLLEVSSLEMDMQGVVFHFQHEGGALRLLEPHVNNRGVEDTAIVSRETLLPYAIDELEPSYQVEQLDGRHMALRKGDVRLRFRRY